MQAALEFLTNLGTLGLLYAAIGLFGLFGFIGLFATRRIYGTTSDEDREFMDPLPWKLKVIWPFVQGLANSVCLLLPYNYLEKVESQLVRTGVSYLMTAEQFVAMRILSALMFPTIAWLLLDMLGKHGPVWLVITPFVGFLFPTLWLNDARKRRELAVIRAMPVYLDFVTMCVEAGLNLQGAISQAMEKAPAGPLRNEFATVLRDLRSGMSRADALRRMAERLDITEVTSFISAVVQAERMGASLGGVLRLQAEQRREERFQRAEKAAMEAPIKLVFPLIAFIFPVTFIILAFPIAMKFLGQGIL